MKFKGILKKHNNKGFFLFLFLLFLLNNFFLPSFSTELRQAIDAKRKTLQEQLQRQRNLQEKLNQSNHQLSTAKNLFNERIRLLENKAQIESDTQKLNTEIAVLFIYYYETLQ